MDDRDESVVTVEPLILKPVCITWFIILKAIPSAFRSGVLGGLFLGSLLYIIMNLSGYGSNVFWWCFAFAGSLCFSLVLLLIVVVRVKTLDATEYRCTEDGVEYMEGFWTLEKKRITYRVITEVEVRRTLFQRMYGIGTVYLTVPSLSPRGPLNRRGLGGLLKRLFVTSYFTFGGVALEDVDNPDVVYQWVQERLTAL